MTFEAIGVVVTRGSSAALSYLPELIVISRATRM